MNGFVYVLCGNARSTDKYGHIQGNVDNQCDSRITNVKRFDSCLAGDGWTECQSAYPGLQGGTSDDSSTFFLVDSHVRRRHQRPEGDVGDESAGCRRTVYIASCPSKW